MFRQTATSSQKAVLAHEAEHEPAMHQSLTLQSLTTYHVTGHPQGLHTTGLGACTTVFGSLLVCVLRLGRSLGGRKAKVGKEEDTDRPAAALDTLLSLTKCRTLLEQNNLQFHPSQAPPALCNTLKILACTA